MYNTLNIPKINALKNELENLCPLDDKDHKRLKKKFRLEFNYNSNHLEGNTLTYGQTELLLYFDKSTGDVKVSDIEEMKAHDLALSQIETMAMDEERPLTESFICELNKLILVKSFWKEAIDYNGNSTRKKIEIGSYKTTPNSVRLRNGEIHEYATVEETPALMTDLIDWYRAEKETMHPVHIAALFHYKFVCIHPFDDGNGRVARLLMNYILLKNNYPPVIIKSEDKENYLTALQKADTGNELAIVEYIEKQAIWSLDLSIKAANGADIEEPADIEKEIEILKKRILSQSKTYKTTDVTFELVNYINDNVWIELSKSFDNFDDFFMKNNESLFLNGKTYTGKVSRELKEDGNLTANETSACHWEKKLLVLKTFEEKTDVIFYLNLRLNHSNYVLELGYSIIFSNSSDNINEVVFNSTLEYDSFITTEKVKDLQVIVSRKLIEIINKLGK